MEDGKTALEPSELACGDLGQSKLPQKARDALFEAAVAIEEDCGTENGETALYWHLVAIAASHAKAPK